MAAFFHESSKPVGYTASTGIFGGFLGTGTTALLASVKGNSVFATVLGDQVGGAVVLSSRFVVHKIDTVVTEGYFGWLLGNLTLRLGESALAQLGKLQGSSVSGSMELQL